MCALKACEAEVRLLRAEIDRVRPADRSAVARPVAIAWWYVAGRADPSPAFEPQTRCYPVPGICLHGGRHAVGATGGTSGSWVGRGLYLLADGRLVELVYRGAWDEARGAWSASVRPISIESAAQRFPIPRCIQSLRTALEGRKSDA